MDKIYVKARGKLNLTLNVIDKRDDGYHDLESVFQIINLYDEMYIEKTSSGKLSITCNVDGLDNGNNILDKAFDVLKNKHPEISGIKVNLIKNIPNESGLGGGSADCAHFLISMNKLFDLNYTKAELIDIGKNLGADVPPCLHSTPLYATGIGEKIVNINTSLKYYLVLIKPDISFSTKVMFEKLDNSKEITQEYNSSNVIKALETNNLELLCNNLYNVFEEVIGEFSEISYLKNLLLENGAIGSSMTGSGSCVFGIFKDKELSKKAYNNIKNLYNTFWCTSYNNKRK